MDSTQCSGLIVPYAPHSGRWASRGASRLVRPVKRNKNGPMSKLTGPYFIPFFGVLNFLSVVDQHIAFVVPAVHLADLSTDYL